MSGNLNNRRDILEELVCIEGCEGISKGGKYLLLYETELNFLINNDEGIPQLFGKPLFEGGNSRMGLNPGEFAEEIPVVSKQCCLKDVSAFLTPIDSSFSYSKFITSWAKEGDTTEVVVDYFVNKFISIRNMKGEELFYLNCEPDAYTAICTGDKLFDEPVDSEWMVLRFNYYFKHDKPALFRYVSNHLFKKRNVVGFYFRNAVIEDSLVCSQVLYWVNWNDFDPSIPAAVKAELSEYTFHIVNVLLGKAEEVVEPPSVVDLNDRYDGKANAGFKGK